MSRTLFHRAHNWLGCKREQYGSCCNAFSHCFANVTKKIMKKTLGMPIACCEQEAASPLMHIVKQVDQGISMVFSVQVENLVSVISLSFKGNFFSIFNVVGFVFTVLHCVYIWTALWGNCLCYQIGGQKPNIFQVYFQVLATIIYLFIYVQAPLNTVG